MKKPDWPGILLAVIVIVLAAKYAVNYLPVLPERVHGAAAAWEKCDGTVEEKRKASKQFSACLRAIVQYSENDALLDQPKLKTAQQFSRVRHEVAKNMLAGTGICSKGCKFQPIAEVASGNLSKHLGVAVDYPLDAPFPGRPDRKARKQWHIVLENLALGIEESCP